MSYVLRKSRKDISYSPNDAATQISRGKSPNSLPANCVADAENFPVICVADAEIFPEACVVHAAIFFSAIRNDAGTIGAIGFYFDV